MGCYKLLYAFFSRARLRQANAGATGTRHELAKHESVN